MTDVTNFLPIIFFVQIFMSFLVAIIGMVVFEHFLIKR